LDNEQKYLENARRDRQTFDITWKNVSDWLNRVETGPLVMDDGINYQAVQQQLDKHKVCVFAMA
jgi:hypothetical protein